MSIGSIAELKEMKVNEISRATEETGVSLEGVTYWSISDTLDHNLERTNRRTFEQNSQRDTAVTRYAGLYSDFNKEKDKTKQESDKQSLEKMKDKKDNNKKNKLLSFISKIANKIKNTVKRKNVKMFPGATQMIKDESSAKQNPRNVFLEGLRVSHKQLAENTEKQQIENIQIRQDKQRRT